MINSPAVPVPPVGSLVRIEMPSAVTAIVNPDLDATHEVLSTPDAEGYVRIVPIEARWRQVRAVIRETARRAALGEPAPKPAASRIRPEKLVVAS